MVRRGFGRFYPASSPLHALDPRTKLLGTVLVVAGLFFVGSLAGLALFAAAVGLLFVASRVPPRAFLGALWPVSYIVLLTFVFQALFYHRGAIVFSSGPVEVHAGGIRMGFFLASRIVLLVLAAGLLTATTSPLALADGLEILLSPLRRVRFPVHELTMMVTIALRFIPTLQEEAERIREAQAARGAVFDEGGLLGRARSFVPILVPLTVGAFRQADELAEAMESRGYRGGAGRTRYRELHFGGQDALALTCAALLFLAGVAL